MIRLSSAKQDNLYHRAASDLKHLIVGGTLQGRNDSCAAFLRGPAPRSHTHATLIRIIRRQADGFQVIVLYL